MSSEPRYFCDFLDFKMEKNPKPELYKKYFLNYDSAKWKSGGGGGFFKYFDDKGMMYSLLITDDARYGIMLSYDKWDNQKKRSIRSWYSVGDENALGKMIKNEDQFKLPLGTYMKPKDAWLAVNDYLKDPATISKSIQWVDSKDIPWPDVLY